MSEKNFLLFSGSSHIELAQDCAREWGSSLGKGVIQVFPDGEIGVQIQENVREREVFVLQTLGRSPNHYLMELLIMIDALKRASAKRIHAVIPYYAYARQDRRNRGREPITARLVADLLEKAGVDRVITLDLHTEQIEGFFSVPHDHLYARPYLVEEVKKNGNLIVVSPDVGSNKMARRYAEDLGVEIALVDKRRRDACHVDASVVVGDVKGKEVLLVDDICSTGKTLEQAALSCKEQGALSVTGVVTHLIPSDLKQLKGINRLITTDSLPLKGNDFVEVVSIAPLLTRAMQCVLSGESISSLYHK